MRRIDFQVREHGYSFYFNDMEDLTAHLLNLIDDEESDLKLQDIFQVVQRMGIRVAKGELWNIK